MIVLDYKKTVIVYGIFCFLCIPAVYSSAGSSIFNFLKIDPAAHNAGMGEVNSIITTQSLFSNPAVIPWIKSKEIAIEHLQYIEDIKYSMINYINPINDNSGIGLSVGYLGVIGLNKTISYDNNDGFLEQGNFDFNDSLINMCFGKMIGENFSYGTSIKVVKETIFDKSDYGAMFSFSCAYVPRQKIYQAGGLYNIKKKTYQICFGFFNFGPKVKSYNLPAGGYISTSIKVDKNISWAGEMIGYFDETSELRNGIEYGIGDLLFLRAGYKYPLKDNFLSTTSTIDFTAGLGIKAKNFSFDYAWLGYGDLGNTHRLSITIKI